MNRLLALCLAGCCLAQGPGAGGPNGAAAVTQLPEALWHAPREATVEDWKCGFAGCDHAPAPPFYFVKEDQTGTFPKLSVRDSHGRSFNVKFGGKVITEPFCSRFVSALGYTVEPSWFVAAGRLEGATHLGRSRLFVKPDGSFSRARFQLRDDSMLEFVSGGAWSLVDNPFRHTPEFAGLRVTMMLLSNWDAKDSRNGPEESNTGIFRGPGAGGNPELLYSFFDWGSTLGRWGGLTRRTRSDCSGFSADTPGFVKGVHAGVVAWGYRGKHQQDVKADISVDDLRWLVPWVQRITDTEIRAGLQASGASPRQTACWASALEKRISQLETVAGLGRVSRPSIAR